MKQENYATKILIGDSTEFICLNCGETFFAPKVLGPDNVYRMLPASCRKCGDCQKVLETQVKE